MNHRSEANYTIRGRAVLISDVHLTPDDSEQEQTLRRFFEERLGDAEHLFILGDLFEYWIGRTHARSGHYDRAIGMLAEITGRGIPITILRGNRDIYLGREITELTGAQVFSDGVTLRVGGRRIYVCHGDAFCTRDVGYQRMRAILRSWFVVRAYRLLPGRVGHFLANGYRKASERSVPNKEMQQNGKTSIVLGAVEEVFEQGYDAVVCGHVHTPRQVTVKREDGDKQILVLGDWQAAGWYAEVSADTLELCRFP